MKPTNQVISVKMCLTKNPIAPDSNTFNQGYYKSVVLWLLIYVLA